MHPSLPKYIQLIEILKNQIQQQTLKPNQQLPNEDELASTYNMSRGTVRKAMIELQNQGLVRKEQGRGTFINEPKPALSGFSLVEFDQYIHLQSRTPATQTRQFETITVTSDVAEKLDISPDTQVFHIVQLRLADEMPIVWEERYFDCALCPDLTQEKVELSSVHWLLVEHYRIPLVRLTHQIEIATLPPDKCPIFGVGEAIEVFAVNRLSYTRLNEQIRPAVWYQAYYRADEYPFQAQFHSSI